MWVDNGYIGNSQIKNGETMKKTIAIIAVTIVAELILLVIFVQSGLYNVSTLSPDPGPLKWIFSTTSDNSVKHHAQAIVVPQEVKALSEGTASNDSPSDSSMIAEGFDHYNDMCVTCHGAPGIDRSEAGQGLYPQPPDLVKSAKELPPQNLFWVIKNGVKSTGMPGFAKTHSDSKIWAMVAFLEKMKNMTPQDYAAMEKANTSMGNMNMNMKMSHHEH